MVIFHPIYVNSFFKLEIMYIKPNDPTILSLKVKKVKFKIVGLSAGFTAVTIHARVFLAWHFPVHSRNIFGISWDLVITSTRSRLVLP